MAFMVFERKLGKGKQARLINLDEPFRLAGYNLLYKAWKECGEPVDQGWHVTQDQLIKILTGGAHSLETRRLVIDFDPGSEERIGLIELLDIHAYTFSSGGKVTWTPMMLRLRDVFYKDGYEGLTAVRKAGIIADLPEPADSTDDYVEFLYLNGERRGWNWGSNGRTNAAFIESPAREYFRKFF